VYEIAAGDASWVQRPPEKCSLGRLRGRWWRFSPFRILAVDFGVPRTNLSAAGRAHEQSAPPERLESFGSLERFDQEAAITRIKPARGIQAFGAAIPTQVAVACDPSAKIPRWVPEAGSLWRSARRLPEPGRREVTRPIHALISWIAAISGKVRSIVHRIVNPNWAPTWEYVVMPLGSSSEAPVTMPGPSFARPRNSVDASIER